MKHKLMENNRPKKGQIKVSEILAYVARERDLFPLPAGYVAGETVYYDLPVCVKFEIPDWTAITKADFAASWGVAQSQVSRWISAGLPVREDGLLSHHEAIDWVCEYKAENAKRRDEGWR